MFVCPVNKLVQKKKLFPGMPHTLNFFLFSKSKIKVNVKKAVIYTLYTLKYLHFSCWTDLYGAILHCLGGFSLFVLFCLAEYLRLPPYLHATGKSCEVAQSTKHFWSSLTVNSRNASSNCHDVDPFNYNWFDIMNNNTVNHHFDKQYHVLYIQNNWI